MRHPAIADLLREAVMFQIRVEERAIAHGLCGFIGAKIARFSRTIAFLSVNTAAPADLRARPQRIYCLRRASMVTRSWCFLKMAASSLPVHTVQLG